MVRQSRHRTQEVHRVGHGVEPRHRYDQGDSGNSEQQQSLRGNDENVQFQQRGFMPLGLLRLGGRRIPCLLSSLNQIRTETVNFLVQYLNSLLVIRTDLLDARLEAMMHEEC